MLCTLCANIFQGYYYDETANEGRRDGFVLAKTSLRRQHHKSAQSLHNSMLMQCSLCYDLYRSLVGSGQANQSLVVSNWMVTGPPESCHLEWTYYFRTGSMLQGGSSTISLAFEVNLNCHGSSVRASPIFFLKPVQEKGTFYLVTCGPALN